MKTVYLLPCSCGCQHEVDGGQAGTQIECTCGRFVAVPSIRGLRQLETTTRGESQPRATWSAARGAVFSLGLLLSVLGVAFSAFNAYRWWQSRRLADPAEYERKAAYQEVDELTPEGTLAKFRLEETVGLGEPFPPVWTHIDKMHADSGSRAVVGMVVAGVGLVAAAGSMVGRTRGK